MKRKIFLFLAILACAFAIVACSISTTPPVGGQATPTEFPQPTRTPEATATSAPGGVITGNVNYPSEFIPPQRVVAYNAEDFSVFYFTDTLENQSAFEIPVPPGTYYVVSYVLDGSLAGGYSQAVPCGLQYGCDDHSLIPIEVAPGVTVTGVNPHDWYAPAGSFPPMP